MNRSTSHLGRSVDFLSRLHDNELTAAERAHFESHRAHCAECRQAAVEFEAALALYRSSRPSPAPADLAARILRKLQVSSPRRSPFGVFFGIDLKWAGAFAAALIAVIIGSSIVVQRETKHASAPTDTTISVVMQDGQPRSEVEKSEPRPAPPREVARRAAAAQPPPSVSSATPPAQHLDRDFAREPFPAGPSASEGKKLKEEVAAAPTDQVAAERDQEQAKPQAKNVVVSEKSIRGAAPSPSRSESLGGDDPSRSASTYSVETRPTGHVSVLAALDNKGTAPALLNPDEPALSSEDRGEYVVLVNAQGAVIKIDRPAAGKTERAQAKDKRKAGPPEQPHTIPVNEALRRLRFQPSDRMRLILLRVE